MGDNTTSFARSLLATADGLERSEDEREAQGGNPSPFNRGVIDQMRRLGRMTATEREEALAAAGIDYVELARAVDDLSSGDVALQVKGL
jgi:hypothetical protein